MELQNAWSKITSGLKNTHKEFPTVPKNQRTPVWFQAFSDGEKVYIGPAHEHKPSSKLAGVRVLTFHEFERVYPFYLKRENGQSVSREVTAITANQVYYFSLIYHLCK